MAANRNRRLAKEVQDVQKDIHSGVSLKPVSDGDWSGEEITDLTHFHGVFKGPPDTAYEGGTYIVDIIIPNEYPFQPPKMRFITKIWHPNVSSQTGAICLDTLGTAWSPILTLKSALISLQSLLSSPEPRDPQDAEVARMLITNPDEFNRVAQQWAVKYAGAPEAGPDAGSSNGNGRKALLEARAKALEEREEETRRALAAYRGYNPALVQRFGDLGFEVSDIVTALEGAHVPKNNGQDIPMGEDQVSYITERLFGGS